MILRFLDMLLLPYPKKLVHIDRHFSNDAANVWLELFVYTIASNVGCIAVTVMIPMVAQPHFRNLVGPIQRVPIRRCFCFGRRFRGQRRGR